jgi:hypothetical protein
VGRWSSPRPPRPCPSPGWPSRVPLPVRPAFPEGTVRANLLTFAPLRSLPIALVDSSTFSLGFVRTTRTRDRVVRLSPLHRRAREASTPATTAGRRFGLEGATLEVPFRPRGFSPPRRLPPLHESRACCIPLPILGSTAFPLEASRPIDRDHLCFPAMQVRTPRRNPRPTAVTCHHALCPLAVPCPIVAALHLAPVSRDQARRGERIGSVGFEALLRRRVW